MTFQGALNDFSPFVLAKCFPSYIILDDLEICWHLSKFITDFYHTLRIVHKPQVYGLKCSENEPISVTICHLWKYLH